MIHLFYIQTVCKSFSLVYYSVKHLCFYRLRDFALVHSASVEEYDIYIQKYFYTVYCFLSIVQQCHQVAKVTFCYFCQIVSYLYPVAI